VPSHIKLAHAYRMGIGVKRVDETKAAEHFAKATSQSVAAAASQIAEMYENGTGGVKKDETKAAARYQTATDQGDADSAYKLGTMYMEGRGVEKSMMRAREMIDKSVEQGNADAQYHMAILLCKSDPFKAIGLMNHAAKQGHPKAQMQKDRLRKGLQIEDEELVSQSSYQKSVSKVKRATANAILKKRNLLARMQNAPAIPVATPVTAPVTAAAAESQRRPIPSGLTISEDPTTLPPVAVGVKQRGPTTPMTPTIASMKRMTDGLKSLLTPRSSAKKKGFDRSPSAGGANRLDTIKSEINGDDNVVSLSDIKIVESSTSSPKLPAIKGASLGEAPLSPFQKIGRTFSRKQSRA